MAVKNQTGFSDINVFWGLTILLGLGGLVFLTIWSYLNLQFRIGTLGFIFAIMLLTGLSIGLYSQGWKVINVGSIYQNSVSFYLGFALYVGIVSFSLSTTNSLSVLSVSTNSLFSTAAADLPRNINFFMTVFIIPIAEEMFWIYGLPSLLFAMFRKLSKEVSFLGVLSNQILQLVLVMIVCGGSFALFHVGQVGVIIFIVSAIIFRSFMIFATYGDMQFDWIKYIEVLPSFALGAHIGNNLANYGLMNAYELIKINFLTTGWVITLYFGIFFLFLLDGIGNKLNGGSPN